MVFCAPQCAPRDPGTQLPSRPSPILSAQLYIAPLPRDWRVAARHHLRSQNVLSCPTWAFILFFTFKRFDRETRKTKLPHSVWHQRPQHKRLRQEQVQGQPGLHRETLFQNNVQNGEVGSILLSAFQHPHRSSQLPMTPILEDLW